MHDILRRDFRANPRYEIVLFDRLSPGEREALAELRKDPAFYGVLRPRDPREMSAGLGAKSVDRDTALLFLTLREPGPLPGYVAEMLGASAPRTVARLVADGVLEIREGEDFVSGAAALALVGEERGAESGGRLAVLSREALRYAQALAVDDPVVLSWRIYGFNRRPLTPGWKRRLPSAEAVERHLGIETGGRNRQALDRSWRPGKRAEFWLSWRARLDGRGGRAETPGREGAVYKLYVSPSPEALEEGFGEILGALSVSRAQQFKVGADAAGLLRPDKIVAYFPDFDRLSEAAGRLSERLAGLPAHGVPFTAEIAGGGLLSWGADPPASEQSPFLGGWESWRLWLTNRLAVALLAARTEGRAEPWRFALDRVRLEGVDTETWTPGALLWRRE
ncbi:MAG TPA: hypothetical protein VHC97_19380 [Thermoanaerobaculia bacterium]|nr:hypothetical protein [Thermoanaerobaculia bacterium]